MLELDVLLSRFLEKDYDGLGSNERLLFERFLATPDPVLHDWLMGYSKPEDLRFAELVRKIRSANLTARD